MDCSPSGGVPLGLLGMYLSGESTIRLWCSDQSYGHMMMMMMMKPYGTRRVGSLGGTSRAVPTEGHHLDSP